MKGTGTMAHTWDTKPDPKVEHVVNCTTCGVRVERVLEAGKWVNYHVYPVTLERKRGLAPKCEDIVKDEARQAEFNATFVSAEGRKNPKRHPVYGWPIAGEKPEEEIKISNDQNSDTELTPASHALFMEFANDAGNWSGTPPTDGNVQMTNSQRGNLTHLKKLGLITTDEYEGSAWVYFTDKGIEYAGKNGVDLTWVNGGARDAGDIA